MEIALFLHVLPPISMPAHIRRGGYLKGNNQRIPNEDTSELGGTMNFPPKKENDAFFGEIGPNRFLSLGTRD